MSRYRHVHNASLHHRARPNDRLAVDGDNGRVVTGSERRVENRAGPRLGCRRVIGTARVSGGGGAGSASNGRRRNEAAVVGNSGHCRSEARLPVQLSRIPVQLPGFPVQSEVEVRLPGGVVPVRKPR